METARSVPISCPAGSTRPQTGLRTILPVRGLRLSAVRSCLRTPRGEGISSSPGDHFPEWINREQSKKCVAVEEGIRRIGRMLCGVEPLDTSAICKGVSEAATDYMKRTVSRILGAPSIDLSVSFKASFHPFHRLLVSAIVTGYTIWNAEYRMSLSRSLGLSEDNSKVVEGGEEEFGVQTTYPEAEAEIPRNASPAALDYIRSLHLDVAKTKEELASHGWEAKRREKDRGTENDLMRYARRLGPLMVTSISRPSSLQVEDVIHELVRNILCKISSDKTTSRYVDNKAVECEHKSCDVIGTSRDYLARLLYWCMLLGYRLRSLENRLQLSCAVGG